MLDPRVWKACAGSSGELQQLGSTVYYFPQGHAEQASSQPDFSSITLKKPYFLSSVSAVHYFANQDTDEVYAKTTLVPVAGSPEAGLSVGPPFLESPVEDANGVTSFAKILTPSDANNGGGFSVPRFCADSIFPPLDFNVDPPVQQITVRDMHGKAWEFRHIYRGTPRRHLLTTGWSKFVNNKKLVAGDSIVFVKISGEIFVGLRRAKRSCGPMDFLRYADSTDPMAMATMAAMEPEESTSGSSGGFSRNCRGRVPPETVVEAVRLAGLGRPFEVMYYPRPGSPNFVVRVEVVDNAMRMQWLPGLTIRMAVETEDSSRMTWFQGTVLATEPQDLESWPSSAWGMLQVKWDEPAVLPNVKCVSPWHVEIVLPASHLASSYPTDKKFRAASHGPGLLPDGERNIFLPMPRFASAMMEGFNPSLFGTFPAGMQGARHDLIHTSSLTQPSDFITNQIQGLESLYGRPELSIRCNTHSERSLPARPAIACSFYGNPLDSERSLLTHPVIPYWFFGDTMPEMVNLLPTNVPTRVPADLSIGTTPSSSPPCQGRVGFIGTEPLGNLEKTIEATGGSMRLFGQTFQIEKPTNGDNKSCKC